VARHALRGGDRVRIAETNEEGTVEPGGMDKVRVQTDAGVTYILPPILVTWLPPLDEPELTIGARYRNAEDPSDERRWWYLPDSTTDTPFINVAQVGDSKTYRHYWGRDALPDRIEVDHG
jgi:hypothetical protein